MTRCGNEGSGISRRGVLGAAGAGLAGAAAAQPAEAWPNRAVRLVVPFAPGGPTDIMARVLSAGLAGPLGQPVVVENRAGGGGNVGAAYVARATPDGYTLLVASTGFVVNPSLFRNPGYDPVREFTPITELGVSPNVILATAASGITTLEALIARARAAPGTLNLANPGAGSTPHLTAELLRLRTGIDFVQVPHNSAALAIQSLLAGTTPIGVTALPAAHVHIRSGALRGLALTGEARWPDLLEVPTMAELGYRDFVLETFQSFFAPVGTPAAVVDRLARVTAVALDDATVRARLLAAGFGLRVAGPAALAARVTREVPLWRDLIWQAGIPQE